MSTMTRDGRSCWARGTAPVYSGAVRKPSSSIEPLGVERPSLGVANTSTRWKRERRSPYPPGRAAGGGRGRPRDTRCDSSLQIGKRAVPSVGYQVRPGSAEVRRSVRCSTSPRRPRRGESSPRRASYRTGDVEVHAIHGVDGRVHQLLEPVPQVLLTFDHQIAVGFEPWRWFRRCRCPRAGWSSRTVRTRGSSPPRSGTVCPSPIGRSR